jgi:hypothetical protein
MRDGEQRAPYRNIWREDDLAAGEDQRRHHGRWGRRQQHVHRDGNDDSTLEMICTKPGIKEDG